ncbi:MAG TPA: class I SAM-dependent methyltransferase [Actinomycetota bacterium]|nr:class I SAM-dependent methyltransferase [Actinomycetota bacterium]
MGSTEDWAGYHNPLGLRSLTRRMTILWRQFLNHRFERRSPISVMSEAALNCIYRHEVILPPRHLLMQPGTQTIDGLFLLVSLAKELQARVLFEIGTFTGLTAWCFARNLPDAEVNTLDIPSGESPLLPLEESDLHRAGGVPMAYDRLQQADGVRQHWGDSATFDFSSWREGCDLVYIDGAHSEQYVESDTSNALQMLSSSGAVVWDDYWRLSPGVVTVLHQRRGDLELFRVPGTRLVVHLAPDARRRLFAGVQ